MNYVHQLSTALCFGCNASCHFEEMHAEHTELCGACGDNLQSEFDAERTEELLSDDEIVAALLEADCGSVVDAADHAQELLGDRYSARGAA